MSAPDPFPHYQKALKQRQANTGVWFLESEQYAKWKTDAASFLWLCGIPGCGKTILSSTILQNVFQYCADDPGKIIAYFYFDFNDPHKQDPELMVRSLISQLSQRSVKLPTILETLYSSCENRQRHPSLDDFLEVLHEMIQESLQSYIILDALDECGKRTELMGILENMAGWRLESLHILATSRKERDIESLLEDFVDKQNTIYLQSKLVDKDIHTYIRQRLSDDKSLRKWQNDRYVQQEIETALMEGAHGMYIFLFQCWKFNTDNNCRFRWAVLQLDTLGKCRNRLMLRESLATLPPTLDQTYDRILCAISENDSEYAVRILRWLAFSARPLLVEEISEVVAIDPERDPAFDCQEVLEDPLDALDICSSLVTIATPEESFLQMGRRGSVSTRKVILLAHYSVKEYLISARCRQDLYRMQNAACNEFIAKSCLKYLLQFQSSVSFTDESIEESKLALYSAEFWTTYIQGVSYKAEALNRLVMELFLTGNDAYLNWIRIYDPDKPGEDPDITRQLENVPTPLYYASLLGLTKIVSLLILEAGADGNAQGGGYGNALQAASARGHDQVVQRLLEAGADVNAQRGGGFSNALQVASAGGHDRVV